VAARPATVRTPRTGRGFPPTGREFSLDGSEVVLSHNTPRPIRMAPTELVDNLLAGLETIHAN
jgi:hypothetical protein